MKTLGRVAVVMLVTLSFATIGAGQDGAAPIEPMRAIAGQLSEKLSSSAQPTKGELAEVDWEDIARPTLYVLFASTKGILEGTPLTIKSKGEPIEVGGEAVGFREKSIGTALVTGIQSERLLVAKVQAIETGTRPSKGDFVYVRTVPAMLAVTSFEGCAKPDSVVSKLGQGLADAVGLALQEQGRIKVVPRAKLEEALAKQAVTLPDALRDPSKLAALSEELQVPAILTGTITRSDEGYAVLARVVDAQTGMQIEGISATAKRDAGLDGAFETPAGPVVGAVRVLYVGTSDDMVHNEGVVELLSKEFSVDAKPKVPGSLAGYSVVILDKTYGDVGGKTDRDDGLMKSLQGLVAAGKGVVLADCGAWMIGGWSGMDGSSPMRTASEWVGCGSFSYIDTRRGLGSDGDRMSLQVARPNLFGQVWPVGAALYSSVGARKYACVSPDDLEASAAPVAQLVAGRYKGVGALANTYGKGRVYWQSVAFSPNSPQLNEMFTAGVRWAAGLVGLDGKTGQASGH